jgi:hypothetical protein
VLQLRYIPTECDSRSVCSHIQRVYHLAVNIWGVGESVRGLRPGEAAVALNQMPGPRKVVRNLGHVIIGRSVPGPVPGANAASNRLPDNPQAFHRVRSRHVVRRRRQRCPQVDRRRDQLMPASYHRRSVFGRCVEERLAGQCVTVGQ